MTYDLYIGDRTFSSWSLRGWLMMEKFKVPHRVHNISLYAGRMAEDMASLAPARLVPAMRCPDGTVVGESLAMAETLAEQNPDARMWPEDAAARATARWLCAEMVGGFAGLRSACPMQLRHVYESFVAPDTVRKDLARLETIWAHAAKFKTQGDWLFGRYSLADVFYAPVCARIVGYDLPVSDAARAYALRTLSDPAVQSWRAEGQKDTYASIPYDMDLPSKAWPV